MLDDDQVAAFRRDGFTVIRGAIDPDRAGTLAAAAAGVKDRVGDHNQTDTFTQLLNVWEHDDDLRGLTLDPELAGAAERLCGRPVRVWHDQVLIKEPHNQRPTEFHQDQPYWPHEGAGPTLTAWVALVDVPVERGCMSFIPGSQALRDLEEQDLEDAGSLFTIAPQLAWQERVTVPLRAGDLTFHDGRTAHTANANATDDPRIAHAVIYIDADTPFSGAPHPITDGMGLAEHAPFPDDRFPRPARR